MALLVVGRNFRRRQPSGIKLGHCSHGLKRSIFICLCFLDAPRWAAFPALCSYHNTLCDYDFTATWSSDHRLKSLNPWLKIKFPSLGVSCFRYFFAISMESQHTQRMLVLYISGSEHEITYPHPATVFRENYWNEDRICSHLLISITHSTSVCSPDLQALKYQNVGIFYTQGQCQCFAYPSYVFPICINVCKLGVL